MRFLVGAGLFIMGLTSFAFGQTPIKEPNVAGQFYPDNAKELASEIETHFALSSQKELQSPVEVMIAPHAGYFFSGGVAAYSFKAIAHKAYKTIVVIAPSHFFPFEGISVWPQGGFKTPLGIVSVDEEFASQLLKASPKFQNIPKVFDREHALEVELPFLQQTFKDFKIVPILMGQPNVEVCQNLARALDQIIGKRDDVLIVVSTDLSHYHPDEVARQMDQRTLEAIAALKSDDFWQENLTGTMEMCGFTGVMTALLYAQLRHLKPEVLKYANSSEASGDKNRVVGYSAVAFSRDATSGAVDKDSDLDAALASHQKKRLLQIARETVQTFVTTGKVPNVTEDDARLKTREGAFVTLRKHGELRGCIGHIIGRQPLYQTVRDMAVAAASQDSRFDSVSVAELSDLEVEVSVLSVPQVITNPNEIELGKHGVIVSQGPFRSGLFLPQVATETGWDKETFLSVLCTQKAGLPAQAWKDPKTRLEIFTADVFSEKDVP